MASAAAPEATMTAVRDTLPKAVPPARYASDYVV
jgi:hypothetical protein